MANKKKLKSNFLSFLDFSISSSSSKIGANASEPTSSRTHSTRSPPSHLSPYPSASESNLTAATFQSSSSSYTKETRSWDTSTSSPTSLSSFRGSLSENPHIYDITEIRAATNNFLSKRYSSASSSTAACWRCNLRGHDTVVFQRKFRRIIQASQLKERLSVICRSNHMSIIKLLGASLSGDYIYLVYDFIDGSNLAQCLRNPRNPSFTVLSTWMSRMQIATDLAHGLDYVHNSTGLNLSIVHSHIKSSSIIVTEPSFNARICHFGTAQLCGETDDKGTIEKEIKGVRDYMSPEFRSSGIVTQKSDVFAFGVVILELLSGKEPLKYRFDKKTGDFLRTSVMDTAAAAATEGKEGLRRWVDRRMNDSFPVEVAEKLICLALDCVHVDPDKRPEMGRVAGKISKLYLESRIWSDNIKLPTGISVSLAPR